MNQQTEQSKTIYIEIDEEISSIVSKLKKVTQKDIYLVLPLKSLFSTSVVNLKILKEFLEQNNKNIFLVTKDKATRNLASSVGLSVYTENPKNIPFKAMAIEETEKKKKIDIEKILDNFQKEKIANQTNTVGSINKPTLKKVEEEKPLEKFSIEEIISQTKDEEINLVNQEQHNDIHTQTNSSNDSEKYVEINFPLINIFKQFWQKLRKKDLQKEWTYHAPNRFLLTSFITISLLLFFFVIYIVLPNSKIYITPKFEKLDYSTNIHFLFTEEEDYSPQKVFSEFTNNVVIARKMEIITDKTMFFPATGEKAIGSKSSGYITIYNKSHLNKRFIPSRFMTSDGLIFWTQETIDVPARGSLNVFVKAADYDINNQTIGNRGNIPQGQTLTLPALPKSSPSLYYAVNHNAFNNADVEIKRTVTEYDLQFAKEEIVTELESQAQKKMEEYITEQNSLNQTNMQLLKGTDLLDYEVVEVNIPDNIIGQMQDDFVVYGKLKVTGFEYNQDDLLEILKEGLEKKVNPNMRLTKADGKGIEINPTEEQDDEHIKVEATISGVTAYDFSQDSITGGKMTSQVKQAVVGKHIDQADNYLRNMEEIFDLRIENWPVWSKSMPNVESNIEIVIE